MSAKADTSAAIEARIRALADAGVEIVDPRQTYIGPQVDLHRIHPGAVLHPGTRVSGARTFIGGRASVGREGPTVLIDAVLAADTSVASGFVEGAVLLEGASVGANGHLRPGTILEEQASTAHTVGLKHTILLPFVTLGSAINFCDCLMAGGSSRRDHSEVGSGFIHFNFTPWGERGDKATPSLIGDVVAGVFLRQPRVFLGGAGGLVGPAKVGYGAISAAGQVLRRDVEADNLVLRQAKGIERRLSPGFLDRLQPRLGKNIRYIGQLYALRAWYRSVRLARLGLQDPRRAPVLAGLETVELAIAERRKQLARFVQERGGTSPSFGLIPADVEPSCPLGKLGVDGPSHLEWVRALSEDEVVAGRAWLAQIAERSAQAGAKQG